MAGGVLGTTFLLLLLASIIQGFQNVKLFHKEKEEAVVGQNVTLPCIVKEPPTELNIFSVEWSKRSKKNNTITKLALYSVGHGENLFLTNLFIQIEKNEANRVLGSYLVLPEVKKWDTAIYICHVATFPLGTFIAETKLSIKDDSTIQCNVQSTILIHNGENVTIDCNASFPNAQYRWTKNKNMVSHNASLKLWRVTDANAGIYTLTVNMGNKTLHEEFNITVLPATTTLRTDIMTASSHQPTETTASSLAPITMPTGNNPNTSNATTVASEKLSTTSTDSTIASVTSSPTTSSDPTTSRYESSTVFRSTQKITRDQSKLQTSHPEGIVSTRPDEASSSRNFSDLLESPEATPTLSIGKATGAAEDKVRGNHDEGTEQGNLLLVLIVIPMLLLIAVAGFLYRKQLIKRRMNLPPPFKPPPPPIKYTAPRHRETSTQPF